MTRDPDRIDDVLDAVESYWKQHPDLRLGQIISNMAYDAGYHPPCVYCGSPKPADPFYMEDDELLEVLEADE